MLMWLFCSEWANVGVLDLEVSIFQKPTVILFLNSCTVSSVSENKMTYSFLTKKKKKKKRNEKKKNC